tara:strand:- start:452 stop:670 length:219 start_codon:yes stop_codon:yes gene_type:complete
MHRYLALLLFIGLAWGQATIAVFDLENNGLKTSWYSNGQKEIIQLWKDEKKVKTIGRWNPDGSVKKEPFIWE